jgi:predicted metalloprotease with PDZ domain
MFALDAELRKRSKGETGVCDLMLALYEQHNIHVEDKSMRGVQYNDIRKALTSLKGGRRLGTFLDSITKEAGNLDLNKAFSTFALNYKPSDEPKRKEGTERVVWEDFAQGWLGVHVRSQGNKLKVTSHMQHSPAREQLQVGDEIIAIDGIRVVNAEQLKTNLKGKVGTSIRVIYARNSVLQNVILDVYLEPNYPTVTTSDGNRLWKSTIRSRQADSE